MRDRRKRWRVDKRVPERHALRIFGGIKDKVKAEAVMKIFCPRECAHDY